jgi:serine phosphatase RsbU (regulator of sigma subunit)
VGESGSPPLGLGADPAVATVVLAPGDRLLLFTDGLIEARDATGRFVDVTRAVATLATGPLETVLARLLSELRGEVGGDLGDDLALLLAEFAPDPAPAASGEAEAAPGLVSQPGEMPIQLDSRTARSP